MSARPVEKLLHVLGGGRWQVPTVERAKELGYRVLVTDIYKERPAYAIADHHEVVDIRDVQATLAVAERYRVDGILCDSTDVGVPAAAAVAGKLGLPGMGSETALNFTDKSRMRLLTSRAGVPNPAFRIVSDVRQLRAAAEEIGLPLAVKPADSQSSRGVRRVDRIGDLEAALAAARAETRKTEVLAEEWINGTEVTVESVVWDGKVQVLGISDKDHYAATPQIASRLTYPADFSAAVLEELRKTHVKVVQTLGLDRGVNHAEYLIRDGKPYLVEIAARGGGNRIYSHIIPYLSGFSAVDQMIRYALDEASPVPKIDLPERAVNLQFFQFPAGRVEKIEGLEQAARVKGVLEVALEFNVGDELKPIDNDRARPGYVVAGGKTRDEVFRVSKEIESMIRVKVRNA